MTGRQESSQRQRGETTDRFYRAIFESAVDFAIIAMDRRGTIIDWNSGAGEIFGWTADQVIGTDVGLIFTPEDRAAGRPDLEMRDALALGRASDERWHLRQDGTVFWASGEMMPLRDSDDRHIGYLKILRDRTDQRAADATLRETVGLNTLILRAARDCIVVLDLDGRTLFVNQGGIDSMEIGDVDAVIGTSWLRVWKGNDLAAAQAAIALARDGGIGQFQGFCATHKGAPKWWDVVISPLPGADGGAERLVSVGRDITEWRQTQRRQTATLEFSNRLRSLDSIAGITAHACETLADYFGASRAGYGLVDLGAETVTIDCERHDPSLAPLPGIVPFRNFGSDLDEMRRGEVAVFTDTPNDPRSGARAGRWRELGMLAAVILPIFEASRFVALYFVTAATPRRWSPAEIEFIRNIADRARSLTERMRAQQSLAALNASLEQQVGQRTRERDRAWKNAQDLQVVLDNDGTIRSVNDAWTRILGWDPGELAGRNLLTLVHPQDRGASQKRLVAVAAAPVALHENRYRHRDGSWRWISWVATADDGQIYASGRHITVEREQADALEASEARLRTIFGNSAQLQGLLTPDGTLLEANPVALALADTTLPAIVGLKFWETPWFTATPGMTAIIEAAVAAAASGQTITKEISLALPSGAGVFDLAIRPVLNTAGEVINLVLEATDLTERRRAEEQLRQANKMQAIGQLTGGIAHDFNNLLTGISGNLELLALRLSQQRFEALPGYIAGAQGAAERAAALTHRLLAFSRRQTLAPRPTDVNRLAGGMEDLIRRTVGPGIMLEYALAEDLWPTLCDPNQLENALLNLCINARDAMPDGGRLTVETGNRRLDDRTARAAELEPGHYVSLCVSDNGSGMTPEIIARAFDPFFTTKPIGLGTGLGLSMIYGFARQSGGQVRIYSEPDHGTMVCLYLPRHRGAIQRDEPDAARSDNLAARPGETVLVVDDEPTVRRLVTEALGELGYCAIEAEDGAGGLAILQSSVRIDLLVTDVGLPGGMNGRQMADAARRHRPDLKVLFITGYAETAVISHGHLDAGMHVLTKPFSIEALAGRIKRVIAA